MFEKTAISKGGHVSILSAAILFQSRGKKNDAESRIRLGWDRKRGVDSGIPPPTLGS